MKFSLIVPVYNVEKYIHSCVDSILQQTYRNIEVVLVDDGSPDNCPQICDEYAQKDHRIRVIHQNNGGPSAARNSGLKVATGDYILFVDSDDSLLNNTAIEKISNSISNHNDIDVFFTNRWSRSAITASGLEILDDVYRKKSSESFQIAVWNKIYKTDFLLKNTLFFEEGYVHEDSLWTCQVLFHAKQCMYIDCNFYSHQLNPDSIVHNPSQMSIYRRSVGKMHMSKKGIDYFLGLADNVTVKSLIANFLGIYISGVVSSSKLSDPDLIDRKDNKLQETLCALKSGLHTQSLKYKILALLYILIGKKTVSVILFFHKG